jgi:hypothetical protein
MGTAAATLPIWWLFTLHEPRFFLAHAGLGLVCVPWAMVAIRGYRPWAGLLVGSAALLSAALVIDQQLAPLSIVPSQRAAFYERLYAVDPFAQRIAEDEPLLQVTGFGLARVDYASTYPLLGPAQKRLLVSLDASETGTSSDIVVSRMRGFGVRYAYVTAVASQQAIVERLFATSEFRLLHSSNVTTAGQIGSRRPLFREVTSDLGGDTFRRYVFELTSSTDMQEVPNPTPTQTRS